MEKPAPSKLIRNSSIYAAGNILRQLVSFVMLPIYTTHLTPADYGVVGLVAFAISIFEALLGAKLVHAMPKFYHEQKHLADKYAVISTAFIVTGALSTLTVTVLFAFRDPLSQILFSDSKFGLIVGLSALQMLAQSLEYYALLYLRLVDKPITFIVINIAKLFTQLALNIWLVVHLELGVLGVAISGLASSALFATGLTLMVFWKIGLKFEKDLAKRMLIFSWPLWLSGLASLYIYSSNRYYIQLYSSLDNVGLYELAAKFSGILGLLVWGPFSQYWQTEQFKLMESEDAEKNYRAIFCTVGCALIIAGMGISIFSDTVIHLMAAPAFREAAYAVPFLMIATIFGFMTELSMVNFLSKNETGWLGKNNYLTAIVATCFYLMLIPFFGYVGAALALAAAQGIKFLQTHLTARKRHGLDAPLAPLFMMAMLACAGYVLANHMLNQTSIWLDITIKTAISGLTSGAIIGVLCRDPEAKKRLLVVVAAVERKLPHRTPRPD